MNRYTVPVVVAEVVGVEEGPKAAAAEPSPWPPKRRVARPLGFFLACCVTTFFAGCYGCVPRFLGEGDVLAIVAKEWRNGLLYAVCVISVLMFHEMGHFLMTIRYRVPASYPYFVPFPLMWTGTMGAVIAMAGIMAMRLKRLEPMTLPRTISGWRR